MADFITWSPRASAEGDGRYQLPSGLRPIPAGASSHYSATPTWAEINGAFGSGINQLIAAVRKLTGATAGELPFVVAHRMMRAAPFGTMRSKIDDWRAAQGMAAFEWTHTTPVAGDVINSGVYTMIAELRKALTVTRLVLPWQGVTFLRRRDDPYGSQQYIDTGGSGVGQRMIASSESEPAERYRTAAWLNVPADWYANAPSAVKLRLRNLGVAVDSAPGFTMEIRGVNWGGGIPDASDWGALAGGTLLGSIGSSVIAGTHFEVALSAPPAQGATNYYSLVTTEEVAGSAPTERSPTWLQYFTGGPGYDQTYLVAYWD